MLMNLDYQKNAEVFSAVVEGIPRVAELIMTFPPEKHRAALLGRAAKLSEDGENARL
jgi:hypothetical protein